MIESYNPIQKANPIAAPTAVYTMPTSTPLRTRSMRPAP